MTTSYDTVDEPRLGTQPNYNAEGNQVWDPSVGIYHKPAANQAHSYGGIVGALQDIMVQENLNAKSYPHNFAGIIAAIQDLTFAQDKPPVIPGPDPGNGQIIIDIDGKPEWDIQVPMPDGSLWFDTRQGRLFVSIDEEWYQTNGADGLPIVTNTSARPGVEHPVPGQFWWDASENDLYVFDGIFSLPGGGGFTDDPTTPGAEPVWKLITDGLADAFQTTRTLPLGAIGPRAGAPGLQFNYITEPEPTEMKVQSDYNIWLFDALKELDTAIYDKSAVVVDEEAPIDPKVGDFWYDTASLELSVWYEDDDSGQWVPTSTAYSYDDDITTLNAKIDTEQRQREIAVTDVYQRIENLRLGGIPDVDALEQKVAALEDHVNNHPVEVDLTGYATNTSVAANYSDLTAHINEVNARIPNVTPYATNTALQQLQVVVGQLPTTASVAASITAAQPDLSSFTTQAHIDNSISNITTEYLPRTGGTLSGSFIVNKVDLADPAFDFSQEKWYSYNTHKYRTNSTVENFATFGTNEKPWEYAWDFSSNEDFCWVYGNNSKVFSITKDGPACSSLVIGDFSDNTNNGRVIRNKIDVKDRLVKYQFAFETMRQGVANATDFDSLKANILSALASV